MELLKTIANNRKAFWFIIFLGSVSLFSDMTYEGARSITGPYLQLLGASALTVGFVAGFGEFLGYALRLVSGFLADRTQRYWLITIVGYLINLLVVPFIGLTNIWQLAALLIILERVGKAIRTPARDAMLSHAGHAVGMGFTFGLHEALDQIGAMIGPLIIAAVLYHNGDYREAFMVLFIPALVALAVLFMARKKYPHPRDLEIKKISLESTGLPRIFWIYLAGASCLAAGFADFSLMSYHFEQAKLLSPALIPITYAIAMGCDAVFSMFLGYCFDKWGMRVLILITFLSAFFAPLAFLAHSEDLLFLGVILWAIGIGSQGSIMRAVVGNMTPPNKRASTYGIFNMSFGLFWFLGSIAMGELYEHSLTAVVAFAMALQFLALIFFVAVAYKKPQL